MNTNDVLQTLQKGFRVAVGATASLVETLQDPQKRTETFSELQTELNQRTQEWAEKGAVTEQEARKILEAWLSRQRSQPSSTTPSSPTASTADASTPSRVDVQELKDLTDRIVDLRTELEQLRQSKGK
jgi:polyhydroxyalkanoate synthesis regulator phasin